jgi:hypothetical protein
LAKGKYQEWLTEEGLLLLEGWARDGLVGVVGAKLDFAAIYPVIGKRLELSETDSSRFPITG